MVLEDKPKRLVPEGGGLLLGKRRHVPAVDQDPSLTGLVQDSKQIEQSRLSAS